MKEDISYKGTFNRKNSRKLAIDIVMLSADIYFAILSNSWIFWGVLGLVPAISIINQIIMLMTKVHFTKDHVVFYDVLCIPRKIAYDKIIGIYDSPNPAMFSFMQQSGKVRVHYLKGNGKISEASISMKDYDAVYCELSARCPQAPYAENEYENPIFMKQLNYKKKSSNKMYIGYIIFSIALVAGLIYWAMLQNDSDAFIVPACISIITAGFAVMYHKKLKRIDSLYNK